MDLVLSPPSDMLVSPEGGMRHFLQFALFPSLAAYHLLLWDRRVMQTWHHTGRLLPCITSISVLASPHIHLLTRYDAFQQDFSLPGGH